MTHLPNIHMLLPILSTTNLVYPVFPRCLRLSAPVRLIPGIICLFRPSPTFFNPHPDVVETLAFWRCAVKQRPASEPPKRNRRSSESPIQQFCLLVFFRKDLRGQPESSACHQVSTSPVETSHSHISKNSRFNPHLFRDDINTLPDSFRNTIKIFGGLSHPSSSARSIWLL